MKTESVPNTLLNVTLLLNNVYTFSDFRIVSSPVSGLEWPRGFQEVKVPTLHDNGTGWW
jgi:hypothetical protein